MEIVIRYLKACLSRAVVQVQAREAIEVTTHRKLVAHIVGIALQRADALSRLVLVSALSWGRGKPVLPPRWCRPLVACLWARWR